MHSLVRRYIKTAIVILVVGLGIGGWMMTVRETENRVPGAYVVSAHTHAILVGFVMTMILGAVRIAGELRRAWSDAVWLRWTVLASGWFQAAGLCVFFYTMRSRIRGLGSAARESRGERF